jgi:hypothetical protein
MHEQKQNNPHHRKHTKRRFLPIPALRLPHQKPFSADAKKRHEPHQKTQRKSDDRGIFGSTKRIHISLQTPRQPQSTPPAKHRRRAFPNNDRPIKNDMPRWPVHGPPHPPIPRKSRIHHQHMPDKLVIRMVVGKVVQNHKGIVNSHSNHQRNFRRPQDHGFPFARKVRK